MDKAEEYIQNYTRNCSNELCYLTDDGYKMKLSDCPKYHPWLTPDHAREVAKIAMEEAIEKAVEWLRNNMIAIQVGNICLLNCHDGNVHDVIENFIKAMEV